MQNVLLKMFFYSISYQNKRVTVIELRRESEQYVINEIANNKKYLMLRNFKQLQFIYFLYYTYKV